MLGMYGGNIYCKKMAQLNLGVPISHQNFFPRKIGNCGKRKIFLGNFLGNLENLKTI